MMSSSGRIYFPYLRLVQRESLHYVRRALLLIALLTFGLSAHAQNQFFPSPTRIAQGESGEVLVVDPKSRVVVSWFPGTNKKPKEFDVPGRPVSIVAGWDKIFVGNERTQTIDVLHRRSGRLLYTLGGEGLYIPRPSDLAVDIDQGLVFVTDPSSARVLVFNEGGTYLRSIPAQGQKELAKPTGIFVDTARGEILVSDFEGAGTWFSPAGGVLIYDYFGNHLETLSGDRSDGYEFSRPQGLAVNDQGQIYLVDSFRGQVLVFDRETFAGVTTIGQPGEASGELMLPLDVLIDKASKDVYVTNNRNRRVEVFIGKGEPQ
jgi:DNA-binding beta-propeller fold protein YncE